MPSARTQSVEGLIKEAVTALKCSPRSRLTAQIAHRTATKTFSRSGGDVTTTTIWPVVQYNKEPIKDGGERVSELVIDENGDLLGRVITTRPGAPKSHSWGIVIETDKLSPQLKHMVMSGLEEICKTL